MRFSPEFLDELRNRVSLAEVVGRRVQLKKRGRDYIGLCPFHKEKTPSFHVHEDKGYYHCFGCNAGGDVIDFVMKTENLIFPEAVEHLANLAGMPLSFLFRDASINQRIAKAIRREGRTSTGTW